MVPRDMANATGRSILSTTTILIGTSCTWCSSPEAVFMDGRDNGPAMTRLGCAPLRCTARSRKGKVKLSRAAISPDSRALIVGEEKNCDVAALLRCGGGGC